jgi:hypothetical protein
VFSLSTPPTTSTFAVVALISAEQTLFGFLACGSPKQHTLFWSSMQSNQVQRAKGILVTVVGRNKSGRLFKQDVSASNISGSGALLSGFTEHLRTGDVLSVQVGSKKSRFRVVWVRDSESQHLVQAAVHLLPRESPLWAEKRH